MHVYLRKIGYVYILNIFIYNINYMNINMHVNKSKYFQIYTVRGVFIYT